MKNKSKPKIKQQQTEVIAAYCNLSDCWLFSRAHHDFRWCPGRHIAIDGGFTSYSPKIAYNGDGKPPEIMKMKVNATREQLYNDWNKGEDKFGIIHNLNS